MCGEQLKYLTNGISLLEMTLICGKFFKYVTNGLNMREMT